MMQNLNSEIYQEILNHTADGIITIDTQGRIQTFNPAAETMFGYDADEIIGRNINCLMPEPDSLQHDNYLHRYRENRRGHIIGIGPREVMARRRDGSTFPMDLAISELQQTNGQHLYIGITRDITQRKRVEAKLLASEERFELVARGTKVGIWDWDLITGRIYFSSRCKTMLGYDEADIENHFLGLQALIHPDDLNQALECWDACMFEEADDFDIDYRLRNKQNEYRWIRSRGAAQFDGDGNPLRLAGSHIDITKRVQVSEDLKILAANLEIKTERLERSNRELDQFAYITSHDLKAPLRAIANLSQWIEEDMEEVMTDDIRKQMGLLRGRVQRMENLINGILRHSRIGRVNMDSEVVDVASLLDDVINDLSVPDKFKIEVAPGMPTLHIARLPLFQVFANLIDNAIRFHHQPDAGQLTISMQALDTHHYEFSITDNGPGIATEYHDKVFQIFQTLNARDTLESTGVGLTIAKKIVEELGGKISLDSAEGEGATFRFTVADTKEADQVTNDVADKLPIRRASG